MRIAYVNTYYGSESTSGGNAQSGNLSPMPLHLGLKYGQTQKISIRL